MTAPGTRSKVSRSVDWAFRDRSTGRFVVVQWPNPALLVFLVARGLEWALGADATVSRSLHWLGTAALLWWSFDELIRGVNPFRRGLGAVVLCALGFSLLRAAVG